MMKKKNKETFFDKTGALKDFRGEVSKMLKIDEARAEATRDFRQGTPSSTDSGTPPHGGI